jgi:hypothetical protein
VPSEASGLPPVALDIPHYLRQPKLMICFERTLQCATSAVKENAAVPKISIDEDCDFLAGENEINRAAQHLPLPSIIDTRTNQLGFERDFASGAFAPDGSHPIRNVARNRAHSSG